MESKDKGKIKVWDTNEIKNFISKTEVVESFRTRVIEALEGMRIKNPIGSGGDGYNESLESAIEKIKNLK